MPSNKFFAVKRNICRQRRMEYLPPIDQKNIMTLWEQNYSFLILINIKIELGIILKHSKDCRRFYLELALSTLCPGWHITPRVSSQTRSLRPSPSPPPQPFATSKIANVTEKLIQILFVCFFLSLLLRCILAPCGHQPP